MKRSIRYSTLTAALLAGSFAQGAERPGYDASYAAAPAAPASAARRRSAAPGRAIVASTDARTGSPRFVWASKGLAAPQIAAASPESATRAYVAALADLYRLAPAALDTAKVAQVHDIGSGAIVVVLRQEVNGVEVFHSDMKVVMGRNLELVAVSGSLHPGAAKGPMRGAAVKVAPDAAVARALADLYGAPFKAADLVDRKEVKAGYAQLDLGHSPAGVKDLRFSRPARVKQVLFPMPDRLVPAYYLEVRAGLLDSTGSDAYAYVIAADDGRVLYRVNQKHSAFGYRVWADQAGDHTPLDGPQASFTPHPTGIPDGSQPPFVAPVMITTDGFNTNPSGGVDRWLAPNATETSGNNVDAYADHSAPDGFSPGDVRATTTSPGAFDRAFDTSQGPKASTDQMMAAVTQIFYVTNYLHDWYYDSGFNEAAGNAQVSNFGRGGEEGDPLLAEAQDFDGMNNANMDAAADGASPTMQMFLWEGAGGASLGVAPLGVNMSTKGAAFGPQAFDHTNQLALASGSAEPATDACSAVGPSVNGKIALVDRGGCNFTVKALNVQAAGATGIIIANNQASSGPPPLGGNQDGIEIPVLGISMEDGDTLKSALEAAAVTVTMSRAPVPQRDGTIDNTIVAHEWGHYIHLRSVSCGSLQCFAMSEGWGDFIALQMVLREGDDRQGAFPLSIYSTAGLGDAYFGIRRAPYSIDFAKNAFTFKNISQSQPIPDSHPVIDQGDPSEVHNAGEIWAAMLWEAYNALIDSAPGGIPAHTFAEARRLMSNYIVAGMKIAPADPTYTEQRDAILAAAAANDPDDFIALAEGFARRGAGTCAVSPAVDSQTLEGVVEDFNTRPNVAVTSARLDDSISSCDGDGQLDAEETGKVTLELTNTGTAPLADATATVSSTTAGVSFPDGAQVTFGTIDPFATGIATIAVALDESFTQIGDIDLELTVNSPSSCVPTQTQATIRKVNLDEEVASSPVDDVESESPAWSPEGVGAETVWAREQSGTNHLWHGLDVSGATDTSIVSPALHVGSESFVITFTHRYKFEFSQGTSWDGGVIEISTNDGASWVDVSTYADPGYGGTITNESGNPLQDRQGYVNQSPAWPEANQVTLDLGTALAGQTAKVRFRIGTDAAAGDAGWEIDDIGFQGITNTPFTAITEDAASCAGAPLADAGPDQTVAGGDAVKLDGSGSSDPEDDPLTFAWAQTAGPSVELTGADTVSPGFTAPAVTEDTTITLQLQVSDGQGTSTDSVDILVKAGSEAPPVEIDDGCGCSVVGGVSDQPVAPLAPLASLGSLAAAALLLRRRRRS